MNPTVNRDQVEHEARAKIMWGDPPETVIHFLRINGISHEEAADIVDALVRERLASVRGNAIGKILVGAGLLAIPVATLVMMSGIGIISIKLLAIAIVFGLWGAWKVLNGVLTLLFPKTEPGDLADQAD